LLDLRIQFPSQKTGEEVILSLQSDLASLAFNPMFWALAHKQLNIVQGLTREVRQVEKVSGRIDEVATQSDEHIRF
jgi:hypothetical protein